MIGPVDQAIGNNFPESRRLNPLQRITPAAWAHRARIKVQLLACAALLKHQAASPPAFKVACIVRVLNGLRIRCFGDTHCAFSRITALLDNPWPNPTMP